MTAAVLSLRLLWRNWRSGEVKILAGAILLAVAVVTAISVFTSRLEQSLVAESSRFLGADRVIRASSPLPKEWYQQAQERGVQQAHITAFGSMVFSGEEMQLSAVKAVSDDYPLRGTVTLSDTAFATADEDVFAAQGAPAPGEVWVDSRLLPLLNMELGDTLQVGEARFKVAHVIVNEPDRGNSFFSIGPRVMMNEVDLPATEVIQVGSQVSYQWLLAGNDSALDQLLDQLNPERNIQQRLVQLEDTQQGLATTLDRGRSYLLLAGIISVLLAGVAIAIAAQRFAQRHVDQVALLKSLGSGARQVRLLYFSQLFFLALMASAVGLLLGEIFQRLVANALSSLFPVVLGGAESSAYAIGVVTGLLCLIFFALPPLWHLPTIAPLKILRRETPVKSVQRWLQGAIGISAVLVLIYLYSGDTFLTLTVFLALATLILAAAFFAWLLLLGGRKLGMKAGSVWRLALASLQRNQAQSTVQILVFATAIMLLLGLTTIRTTLLDEWELQIPEDAPDHFFVNIAADQVAPINELMAEENLRTSDSFPMVRARLSHVNGEKLEQGMRANQPDVRGELFLTWAERLPSDNDITEGEWWGEQARSPDRKGVSVEDDLAQRMGLAIGDKLTWSIGGLELHAEVESFRTVDWEAMTPNFYFMLSPSALDDFSPIYMTAAHIPAEKKFILRKILREFPTITLIEFDQVMSQIRNIIDQVTQGIELVLWLVFAGGILVLLAAVNASMETRLLESGLLRALGSKRSLILGSVWIEFSVLGLFAGVLAVFGSEVFLLGLQHWVLQIPTQPHFDVWIIGTLSGALFIGALGVWSCRRVVTAAPGTVLRELAS